MLNWIPEWYFDLMYRFWSDDPSKRPTAELVDLFRDLSGILYGNIVDDDVIRQLGIKLHPQSCYINRYIHTLHGLRDSNESTTSEVNTYNIDSTEEKGI
ncbi:hypothetical protein Glove_756g29 [Diversispora epigaea]|uniref:Serine-threonine/tyrosine-protein kinase catalytic domain-containing protein n=1 Tax=Diversispora epigaea TaxID=1348612 RepID=A0A397G7R2_9GLOM|nr:hypothetical protein Glove_756g29 [Diversispora epigaea]